MKRKRKNNFEKFNEDLKKYLDSLSRDGRKLAILTIRVKYNISMPIIRNMLRGDREITPMEAKAIEVCLGVDIFDWSILYPDVIK